MYELRLRHFRKLKGWNQGELAERIGSTLRIISSYERGETEVPLSVAVRLCEVLGCTLDELAGRK